jgi:hypothetical protein
MTRQDGVFLQADEAWNQLGIYGGDDGLTADIDPIVYRKAAETIGQDLTIEPVKRGDAGISFLSRIYSPHVWDGDDNSCCDVKRTLCKLHVTVQLAQRVTPAMKLLEKARSFFLSDQHTPIVGPLADRVLTIFHGDLTDEKNRASALTHDELTAPIRMWLARYPKEVQYKNEPADWMLEHVEKSMPEFDFKKFTSWLETVNTLEAALTPPTFMEQPEAKSTEPVAVDGDVIPHVKFSAKPPRPSREKRSVRFSLPDTIPQSTTSSLDHKHVAPNTTSLAFSSSSSSLAVSSSSAYSPRPWASKMKPKDKDTKSRSPREDRPPQPCFDFQEGKCTRKHCKYSHDPAYAPLDANAPPRREKQRPPRPSSSSLYLPASANISITGRPLPFWQRTRRSPEVWEAT